MHLAPRDIDKLLLHNAGFLAQKRLARGLRLNYPEAVALIATQLLEFIRDGRSVSALMELGRKFLGRNQVMSGVPEMIGEKIEGLVDGFLSRHGQTRSDIKGWILHPGGSWERRMKEDPEGIRRFVETSIPWGRFGTPDEHVAERIRMAAPAELDRWTDRILDAKALADVFAD